MDKNLIVHAARNLFYEQGIENVTVKKIAETCGTATSLINYHFQSKSNLVVNVVEQYSHEIDDEVKDMIYKCRVQYDVLVCNLLSLCVKLDMYSTDEKARNFYLEYLNLGFDTLFSASYEDLYTQIDRSVILDLDPTYNQLPSVSAAAHGALLSLMYAYFSGRLNCTHEQFLDYVLKTRCRILNLSENVEKVALDAVRSLYDRCSYDIEPDFVVVSRM